MRRRSYCATRPLFELSHVAGATDSCHASGQHIVEGKLQLHPCRGIKLTFQNKVRSSPLAFEIQQSAHGARVAILCTH